MKANLPTLARFCLEFVALLLGFDKPELEYALRGALSEHDDHRVADQIEALAKKNKRDFAEHRSLVGPALQALRLGSLDRADQQLLARTALHVLQTAARRFPWGAQLQRLGLDAQVARAFSAMQGKNDAAIVASFSRDDLARTDEPLASVLSTIVAIFGGRGTVVERMEAPRAPRRRSVPPPGLDLDRGRASRADLVMAVMNARVVLLKEVEKGTPRNLIRAELVEAILRDPFWDDIDASVQEDGVVAKILKGAPSPAIDLSARGYPQVYIKRITL